MLNDLGLQHCQDCMLCGAAYGREGMPPHWRRPTQKVQGRGVLPCDVLILGEAPGEKEDKSGWPFDPDGTAGRFMLDMLIASGLDQCRLYITNVVKCRPPGNRKPSPSEASSCQPWLELELAEAGACYVLCLGETAMARFFPPRTFGGHHTVPGKVGDWVGKTLPLVVSGATAIGCYHPAARQASQRGQILPVMQMIASRLGIVPPAREQVDYQVQEV